MKPVTKQNLLALVIGLLFFLVTFTLLSWPFFLATLISLGTYFAVYLLASPVLRMVCGPVYSPLVGITSFLNASSPPAINTSIANEEVFVTWT